MGAAELAEMKAGHEDENVDATSAAPWPQLDGVRPNTSPSLVDDGRRSEDGEGRGGAKYNTCYNFKMEEFFHRFASRGYASISWAFLFMHSRIQSTQKSPNTSLFMFIELATK